ncbi:hypothetical protein CR51_28200 [Caballeronia megalochromosomata]|nr:hypothetical protein CR51_28200 [Caballeronia megalochromosomata]
MWLVSIMPKQRKLYRLVEAEISRGLFRASISRAAAKAFPCFLYMWIARPTRDCVPRRFFHGGMAIVLAFLRRRLEPPMYPARQCERLMNAM